MSSKKPPMYNSFEENKEEENKQQNLVGVREYGLSESSLHEIPKITNEDLTEEIFTKLHNQSNHESNTGRVDLVDSNLSPIGKEESTEGMSSSLDKEPVRETDPRNYENIQNKKVAKKSHVNKKAVLKPTENFDLGLVRKTFKSKKGKKASTFPHEWNGSKLNSEYLKNYATDCKKQIITQEIVQHSKNLLDKLKKMQLFSNKPKKNLKKKRTKRSPIPMKDVAKLFPNLNFKRRSKSPEFNNMKELDNLLKGNRLVKDKLKNHRRKSIEYEYYTSKKTVARKKSPWTKKSPISKKSPLAKKSPISKKTHTKKSPFMNMKKLIGLQNQQMIVPPAINYNSGGINKNKSMVFLIRVNVN